MYAFYLAAGLEPGTAKTHLENVASISHKLIPPGGPELGLTSTPIPEIQGGFFVLADRLNESLFDQFVTPEIAVVVYGNLFGSNPQFFARRIANTWTNGGSDAVHQMNGLFSAVIIDRRFKYLYLLSDAIGSRTCRYRIGSKGSLHISTHDVPLVAAGGFKPELDRTSVASSISYDWSVGGQSLLKGVIAADPFHHYIWTGTEGIRKIPASTLVAEERIPSLQSPQASATIDEMIALMSDAVDAAANKAKGVCVDLTAGLDSRAVLAMAIKTLGPKKVRGRTNGSPKTDDAKIGRQLAAMVGIPHSMLKPVGELAKTAPYFIDTVAYGLNGDYCSKSVWQPPHSHDDLQWRHLSGAGGEIYRGFYYPSQSTGGVSAASAFEALSSKRFDRSYKLPWVSPEDLPNVHERVQRILEGLSRISPQTLDVLDLFYIHERVAHWGVHQEKHPLRSTSVSPFKQPEMARLALTLPPGAGRDEYLHSALIHRYAPQLTWVLINGKRILLPFEASWTARLRRFIAMSNVKYRKSAYECIPWRLRQLLRSDVDHFMANIFSTALKDYTRDSLLSEDSIGLAIFSRQGLVSMLEGHNKLDEYTEEIGLLLTMNSWWRIVQQAKTMAADFHR